MSQSLSAYYEADKGLTFGGVLKYALYLAIGVMIAFYAVPSAAAPSPVIELSTNLSDI